MSKTLKEGCNRNWEFIQGGVLWAVGAASVKALERCLPGTLKEEQQGHCGWRGASRTNESGPRSPVVEPFGPLQGLWPLLRSDEA